MLLCSCHVRSTVQSLLTTCYPGCVLYRREAFLLQYVSLHDQAQEEFTIARAVSPPWGIWGVVRGSPRGTGQEATQTFFHPAAARGAQTTTWRHPKLTEHCCESATRVIFWSWGSHVLDFVALGNDTAHLFSFRLPSIGHSGFCNIASHAGDGKCFSVPRCTGKHHHYLWTGSVHVSFKCIGNISVSLYVILKTNPEIFSICPSGENSDLSAQNALDLLLNMSNARELVGNALQVGGSSKMALYTFMWKQDTE